MKYSIRIEVIHLAWSQATPEDTRWQISSDIYFLFATKLSLGRKQSESYRYIF